MKVTRLAAAATITAVIVPVTTFPAFAEAPDGTQVQILNITDFHGRLGAGEAMAATIDMARQDNSVLLANGDNIGASQYVSSSQNDNPTLDYLNALGLAASSAGNHEFDKGMDDLTGRVADRSDFPILGANVYQKGTTNPALDPYTILDVNGVKVAVIGVVTKDTASLVSPAGIADIDFGDPTEAINRTAGELEALPEGQRPDLTVVEAHLGPATGENQDAALASNDEFNKVVTESDESVDAIFAGHSHIDVNFEAAVPGTDRTRPVMQPGKYGETIADLRLESNGDGTWDVASADLLKVDSGIDTSGVSPEIKDIIAKAKEQAQEIGSEEIGEITEDITRAVTESGSENRGAESTLGNLVADALQNGVEYSQLEAADFGITNPGGLRDDLIFDNAFGTEAPGVVTAGELNEVLPFANDHGVVTLTGADVKQILEEQWQPEGASRPFLHMGVSKELEVIYDSTAERGQRVESIKLNGEDIDPEKTYRVATLSFLASGGDNFAGFTNGTFEQSGLTDFEVWQRYFEDHSPVSPDGDERQADAALDVIKNGTATAEVRQPDDTKNDFELIINTQSDVSNLLFSVEAPQGYDIDWRGGQEEAVSGGNAHAIQLGDLRAGEHAIPFSLTPNGLETDDAETFMASLLSDPTVQYWDNNPLPLGYSQDIPFAQVDASAPSDGSNSEAPAPNEERTDEAQPGENSDENSADGKDGQGGNLPRTGVETMGLIAGALALLLVGAASLVLTRTRRH